MNLNAINSRGIYVVLSNYNLVRPFFINWRLHRHSGLNNLYHRRLYHFDAVKRIYPHPSKMDRGGEDASFCGPKHLGVADGVGSWIEAGIDPGLYSRELLFRVQKELGMNVTPESIGIRHLGPFSSLFKDLNSLELNSNATVTTPKPLPILLNVFSRMKAQGSSTVCLMFLDVQNNCVNSANIGDSGFIIFRPSTGRIIERSKCQQHEHNFPYQLGPSSSDRPEDADLSSVKVEPNDWIVLATDGLWDNVYELQITEILKQSTTPNEAATRIAELAFQLSVDDYWNSPFCEKEKRYQLQVSLGIPTDGVAEKTDELIQKATDAGITPRVVRAIARIKGGKPDDITVIVALVKNESPSEN